MLAVLFTQDKNLPSILAHSFCLNHYFSASIFSHLEAKMLELYLTLATTMMPNVVNISSLLCAHRMRSQYIASAPPNV